MLAYVLFALAGPHAAAALWHNCVRRDGVLLRMIPGSTGRQEPPRYSEEALRQRDKIALPIFRTMLRPRSCGENDLASGRAGR
ncbi:MAG TPA: hypothetical protein VMI72_00290 [Roseiarcus sp.]|nr:hypothetical protein [Roseiarcus sp.]